MENEKKGFLAGVDKFFGVSARGSKIKTEIVAGIVTFLAMCYILTVNPNQFFYAGTANPAWTSVFIATAFGAIVGTLLMAFLAKLPLAQASGMGLNSMVGSIIGGGLGFYAYGFSFSLANAMFMVLVSGILFLLLSVISIKGSSLRLTIFKGIPAAIRTAIPVGIGLFIAYIGFQNAGIILTNQYTQVGFVDFTNWGEQMIQWSGTVGFAAKTASVALIGVILIAVLDKLNVKGSLIIGILGATVVGIPFGVTNLEILKGNANGITWKFWENFADYFTGENSTFLIAFKDGWNFPEGSIFTVIMITISFCMIDMFDTMGTCLGCCSAAGLLDENGTPINYDQIMYSDSIATCTGALLGTSTVTTFVESGAGVAAGGKTGLTALTTAVMFFLAIFLLPVFATIPSAASASALIYVGALMMKGVKNLDFSDARAVIPAFLAIVVMPLGYSITKGIGIAILSYVIIAVLSYVGEWIKYACTKSEEKTKPVWDISVVTIIIFVLFAVYFFVPTVL
ncbi:MAG: NCS2 family permease [Clostridia bacterium]|nr:NCS2 family permease [Clostridia bacterium]MBQ5801924.1 NCS2 family permease [Clostridia bacterium]